MDDVPSSEPVVTEEPFPGWQRLEVAGSKPYYKSPFPRTIISSLAKLKQFIPKEQAAGRLLDVDCNQFSFKRRLGLRQQSSAVDVALEDEAIAPQTLESEEADIGDFASGDKSRSFVELLTRNPEILIDHRKLMSKEAKQIDAFRVCEAYDTPPNFEDLKEQISTATDLKGLLAVMIGDDKVNDALAAVFNDIYLGEISQINSNNSPMSEFPPSVNENIYCKIVQFGMEKCPKLVAMVIGLVVRREEPVMPKDVLRIATQFANLCYGANKDLDALIKLRSLTMQVDGITNLGMNLLADVGLTQCARSLSNHRDQFADIGTQVMHSTAATFPYQSIIDNCDLQSEHLTVESVEKETVDTSSLSSAKLGKEAALKLFNKDQFLLNAEENKAEKKHFLEVVGVAIGKILASRRPEAKKLAKFLPAHHRHENSDLKLTPAITFILKPYPYQETRNPDTIKLLVRIQRQFLQAVAKSKGDDPDFLKLLPMLENPDLDTTEREDAELKVMEAVLMFGEWVGHGDLLTVKMVQEAKGLMAGSATAFGRLEYLGPFRLQMLHMKMKKVCQVRY